MRTDPFSAAGFSVSRLSGRAVISPLKGLLLTIAMASTCVPSVEAGDWARFRGPNGSGVSDDGQAIASQWGVDTNIKWKLPLPGPGHSCPIVVGDRVLLTYWSGYGVDRESPGEQQDLKRHLLCVDRNTGSVLWDRSIDAALPEDRYGGMFAEHGYATHSPVSDGERVYVFFGKTGAAAFDLEGKQLWLTNVGSELDGSNWGSASSPILYENLVIVTAAAESHSLVALDKATGSVVWKQEAEGFGSTWGTPVLARVDDQRTDLVLAVPFEVWGFNPETGKLRWFCEAIGSRSMCSSLLCVGDTVYGMESGPGGGGSVAVQAGGEGDVAQSHVKWSGRDSNRIGTPVHYEGRLYWVNDKILNCVDAATGERIAQTRLQSGDAAPNREGQGGGGRGGRGGGGNRDYSSPVVANDLMVYMGRNGEAFVIRLGDEPEVVAVNSLSADGGDFSASPAISNGELFVRSTKNLYCIASGN